ncbi:MAG: radical SAM protein [Candidatus Marsarchaeota archaeon]|nr:radical SAM protein [Candidatus Marsarchaeota archaeon]
MKRQQSTGGRAVRVLAISTYELGHQPLVLARLASIFKSSGIDYELCDNSVERRSFTSEEDFLLGNRLPPTHIVISVPMHTATRLGNEIADRARESLGTSVEIIALGVYSKVALASSDSFDLAISSDDRDTVLRALGIDPGQASQRPAAAALPDRSTLPGLQSYAHLIADGEKQLVGYVETTVGCAHMCRHCPIPVVFHGRFKAIPSKVVLSQIDQLYQEGARHITFGDPDFLNGPTHSLKVTRAMHEAHPDVTFDATVKVEHVLEHRDIWGELNKLGLRFIVSAFEHTSDHILAKLGKGHTRADIIEALDIMHENGIEVRPSFMPFTPWTDRDGLIDLVEFLFDHDLLESVDPVQLSIRLLVPLESLVLTETETEFGEWDPELLSFEWHSSDPQIDELQLEWASVAEDSQAGRLNATAAFKLMRETMYRRFDMPMPKRVTPPSCGNKPRLSESWFCCAEPTNSQLNHLR